MKSVAQGLTKEDNIGAYPLAPGDSNGNDDQLQNAHCRKWSKDAVQFVPNSLTKDKSGSSVTCRTHPEDYKARGCFPAGTIAWQGSLAVCKILDNRPAARHSVIHELLISFLSVCLSQVDV